MSLRLLPIVLVFFCATKSVPRTTLDAEPPRIASAFFGLDNAMPGIARLICFQAPGKDGMPVTFSRRITGNIDPSAFTVHTVNGEIRRPICATLRPAHAAAKRHTVLLIGEFGNSNANAPASVEVTGDLMLEGGENARGLKAPVTPLRSGPTLVLALQLDAGSIKNDCPIETQRIVIAVWSGGVEPRSGSDAAQHLAGYDLKTPQGRATPFALSDINDRDNYIYLCLRDNAIAYELSFAAGILVDPNGDLNPRTTVPISVQR